VGIQPLFSAPKQAVHKYAVGADGSQTKSMVAVNWVLAGTRSTAWRKRRLPPSHKEVRHTVIPVLDGTCVSRCSAALGRARGWVARGAGVVFSFRAPLHVSLCAACVL
jgi:hypothetical protein